MARRKVLPAKYLKGNLTLGGDKSISHRALILSSLTNSRVRIKNFYPCQDCLTTVSALRALGVKIKSKSDRVLDICGIGLSGFRNIKSLSLGDSGTTYRLLAGLLSGQHCWITLKAASALSQRPMKRIILPLSKMGAKIKGKPRTSASGKNVERYPPLIIKGGNLKAITYSLPVPSAQVKSAILLAALNAKGTTTIIEKVSSRDHTERMLKAFGAMIKLGANYIKLSGPQQELKGPRQINIPGDFSSASFFIVGALLLKGSKVIIKRVGVNPTRTGLLRVLKRMKANIKIIPLARERAGFEPVADIVVGYSLLKATEVKREEVPLLIDELPVLMVAASKARGTTCIRGVGELRVKETDRISSMCYNLQRMGVKTGVKKTRADVDIFIQGTSQLRGAQLRSFSDHRTAMSLVIAGLCAKTASFLDDTSCISKSFPDFFDVLESIKVG